MNHSIETRNPAAEWAEPLADLVNLAWNEAPKRCKPEHGCLDYHRSWGLVRLLAGNGRLPAGEAFFQKELGRIVHNGRRRILISGGADSGLSTIVLKACRRVGVEPQLVFADRCATACEINARFADATGAGMTVVEGDICDLDIEPVDVVVAHSFLLFFEGEKRQQVLNAWYRNLRDGGEVLISNLLKASEADWMTHKSDVALRERAGILLCSAIKAGYSTAVAHEMVEVAERFWRISPGRPPGLTEQNLLAGLMHAGFEDVVIQINDASVQQGPMAMVRQTGKGQGRAEVRAIKKSAITAGKNQNDKFTTC